MGVKGGLQQAVDGGCLRPAQLPQALGRPACGGGQGGVQAHGLEQGQHPSETGGLARARAAGEQHHLALGGQLHRLALLGGIGDALVPLDAPQQALHVAGGQQLVLAHLPDAPGDEGLRLVQAGEIDPVLSGHPLPLHAAPGGQVVQTVLQLLSRHAEQLGGGPHQLALGQKGVAVIQIVGQFEQKARLQPLGVLRLHPQGQGQGVGLGKVYAELLPHQQIGVGLQGLQRHVAIAPAQLGHQLQGQAVLPQELRQTLHTHLLTEHVPDLPGPLGGDAPDAGELLRVVLDDLEHVLSELLHQQPGGGLAHPLHSPGGQVVIDLLQALGQAALHHLRLELGTIGGVPGPAAPHGQILPRGDAGHGAHHRGLLLPAVQAQNRIAVLLVLIDHGGDRPLQHLCLCCNFLQGTSPLLSGNCFACRGRCPHRPAQQTLPVTRGR